MFVMISCLFIAALWLPAGKGLTLALLYLMFSCFFCHFPILCPQTGVVHDCIDSCSLPSYLLYFMNMLQDPVWTLSSHVEMVHVSPCLRNVPEQWNAYMVSMR